MTRLENFILLRKPNENAVEKNLVGLLLNTKIGHLAAQPQKLTNISKIINLENIPYIISNYSTNI